MFFIEKSLKLLGSNGIVSLITPDTWIRVPQAINLRNIVLNHRIQIITTLPDKVFKGVSANCIIFVVSADDTLREKCQINILENYEENKDLTDECFTDSYFVDQSNWNNPSSSNLSRFSGNQFQIFQKENIFKIIRKIEENSQSLGDILDIMQGIVPYSRENHSENIVKNRGFHSPTKLSEDYGPWIKGRSISRYFVDVSNCEYLKYGKWLHRPRKSKYFNEPRLLIQEITGGHPPRICASFYDKKLYHDPGIISCLNTCDISILFFLGIINSNLISWYHRVSSPKGKRVAFPKVLIGDIRNFPIPKLDTIDMSKVNNLVELVKSIILSIEELNKVNSEGYRYIYHKQVELIDNKIVNKLKV